MPVQVLRQHRSACEPLRNVGVGCDSAPNVGAGRPIASAIRSMDDKAQHTLAFVVLTGWALLLWPHAAMRVALGMLAYGAGLEVAQWAVGWRFG